MTCRWCDQEHDDDFLCEPAKQILQSFVEHGEKWNMPTMEYTMAVTEDVEGLLCEGIVVKAAISEVHGVHRAGVIIQPILLSGIRPKPLIYFADDRDLRRMGQLFDDIAGMAVRKTREAREKGRT